MIQFLLIKYQVKIAGAIATHSATALRFKEIPNLKITSSHNGATRSTDNKNSKVLFFCI